MIGTLLAGAGRHAEALASFERAAGARPDRDEPAYGLGLSLAKLERWAPAIEALRRAVAINPASARARYALGVALLAAGRADLSRDIAAETRKSRDRNTPARTHPRRYERERAKDLGVARGGRTDPYRRPARIEQPLIR